MTVLAHGHKLLGSNSTATANHFRSQSLSISPILPTSAWDADGENLLLTKNSKKNLNH